DYYCMIWHNNLWIF
nr:immunoglobulin light chain junction region [Macaca mulatta]